MDRVEPGTQFAHPHIPPAGAVDPTGSGWALANRYATATGELRWAVTALLAVLDGAGTELSTYDRGTVATVRRVLAEHTPTSDSR